MKKIIIAIPLLSLLACGGVEDTENSENEVNKEIENKEITADAKEQIVEDLDNETFKSYLASKGGTLIDVRTPEEVAEGAIEGAVNMNFTNGDFEAGIDSLNTESPVFVYCAAGGRSGKARDLLKEKGFTEIYNLKDGYSNWVE